MDNEFAAFRDQDLFTRFIPAKLTRTLCFKSQLIEYPIGRVVEKNWCDSVNLYIVTKVCILTTASQKIYLFKISLFASQTSNSTKLKLIVDPSNFKAVRPDHPDLPVVLRHSVKRRTTPGCMAERACRE
jgi:hypothetical protein